MSRALGSMAKLQEVCVCGVSKYEHSNASFNEIQVKTIAEAIKIMNETSVMKGSTIKFRRMPCRDYKLDNLKYLEEVADGRHNTMPH